MPAGLQVVNFFKQNITGGGAFESLAPGTGDSATFFNTPQGSPAYIGEVWGVASNAVAELQLLATRFHDQVHGIRYELPSGAALAPTLRPTCVSPVGIDQPIYPSDVLTVQVNGTATGNVNATLILHYQDIPGIAANLITADEVIARAGNQVGINVVPTAGAGDWGASVALNSSDNRLHANRNYAVLGFTCQTACAAVALSGVDTGNLKVGGPILAEGSHDATFFLDLARAYREPLIPVINSNNAGSIVVQAAHTTSAAKQIDVQLVELSG